MGSKIVPLDGALHPKLFPTGRCYGPCFIPVASVLAWSMAPVCGPTFDVWYTRGMHWRPDLGSILGAILWIKDCSVRQCPEGLSSQPFK